MWPEEESEEFGERAYIGESSYTRARTYFYSSWVRSETQSEQQHAGTSATDSLATRSTWRPRPPVFLETRWASALLEPDGWRASFGGIRGEEHADAEEERTSRCRFRCRFEGRDWAAALVWCRLRLRFADASASTSFTSSYSYSCTGSSAPFGFFMLCERAERGSVPAPVEALEDDEDEEGSAGNWNCFCVAAFADAEPVPFGRVGVDARLLMPVSAGSCISSSDLFSALICFFMSATSRLNAAN